MRIVTFPTSALSLLSLHSPVTPPTYDELLTLHLVSPSQCCVCNSQTGLIVACYQGYVDVVIALSQCPYVDVNWQDSEGNTALMMAAQAGRTFYIKKIYVSNI